MNAPIKDVAIAVVDPRLAFLARAGACHDLVVLGEVELGEAFESLVPSFEAIMAYRTCPTCGSAPCVNESFCAANREADKKRRRRK
jgi:hypothetical protein